MNEKHYGGATGRGTGENSVGIKIKKLQSDPSIISNNKKTDKSNETNQVEKDQEKIIKAGRIASEVKIYAKEFIKKGMPLIEIAEKIESKIEELGGKPAFPVNLGINNIAAHYTPAHDDKTVAEGLLKVDFGVHVDGWPADNAFSLDLEGSEENKKIIESSREALNHAIENVTEGITAGEIGEIVQEKIESKGLSPIINLSGHGMDHYELHCGISIPNIADGNSKKIEKGLYAIEPFSTNGSGKVRDGNPSGIYELINNKNVRSPIAREVLELINEDYKTLPFCSRWIVKKLGTKALFGLRQLENNGNLHHFSQLLETSNGKVSQAEETIFINNDGKITITTA